MAFGDMAQGISSLINTGVGLTQGTPGTVVPTWQQTTGQTDINELIKQMMQLQEQTKQSTQSRQDTSATGSTVTQNLTPEQEAVLNQVLGQTQQMMGGASPFSPEAAKAAGNEAMQAAISQITRSGLGDVAAQGTNFGAFSGTAQAEQAANLGARASEAGVQAMLQNQQAFGQLDTQRMQALGNQLNQLLGTAVSAGGRTDTAQQQTTTGEEQSTTDRTQTQESTQDRTATETGTQTTETEYDEEGGQQSPLSGLEDTLTRVTGVPGGGGHMISGATGGALTAGKKLGKKLGF